ncbi:hypothetical protein BSKO_12984 [Bryopsis sp. KO-2023]|nr:hypothetical protein BSKO_12984 [Bryopsis sp. KO-2023]
MLRIIFVFLGLPLLSQTKPAQFDPREFLSSKVIYKKRASFDGAPQSSAVGSPKGCKPKFLYMVARHGTRWPTTKRFDLMKNLEGVFKNRTNYEKYPWMENWELPFDEKDGALHPIGEMEMTMLAQRLHQQFPDLLGGPYSKSKYFVRSTYKSRAIRSAESFVEGLFGDAQVEVMTVPKGKDELLRFFETNLEYKTKSKEHKEKFKEWVEEAIYPSIVKEIEKRAGFERSSLEPWVANAIMSLCQTQGALLDEIDRGCALLSKQELETLEWMEDSYHFFLKGPSENLNCCIARPLLNDLIYRLEVASKQLLDSTMENVRLHFGHAETIYPLLCLLGIGSQPLTERILPFPMVTREREDRFWRASRIIPMAGNFLATLYDCGEGGGAPKVRFSWNEQIVTGDWCQETECDLVDVVKRLKQRAESFGECGGVQGGSCEARIV